ncbi:hypothetical protein JYU34_014532, partial [Plutella xylostella]
QFYEFDYKDDIIDAQAKYWTVNIKNQFWSESVPMTRCGAMQATSDLPVACTQHRQVFTFILSGDLIAAYKASSCRGCENLTRPPSLPLMKISTDLT